MELKKRQDDTLAEVTSIEVKADGMVISAKADICLLYTSPSPRD